MSGGLRKSIANVPTDGYVESDDRDQEILDHSLVQNSINPASHGPLPQGLPAVHPAEGISYLMQWMKPQETLDSTEWPGSSLGIH
jgi:hypothetical protein